jgi:hypothetical protein
MSVLSALIADLASGLVYRPDRFSHLKLRDWRPDLSQPQLEHYLGKTVARLEPEYIAFCNQLIRGRTMTVTGVE